MMKTVLMVLGVCLLAAGFYYSWNDTWGILMGAMWGIVNFYFIKQLIYSLLMPEQKNYFKILIFAFIKFPLLYLVGYGLLLIPYFSPWDLLIGFSVVLVGSLQIWFWNHLRINQRI